MKAFSFDLMGEFALFKKNDANDIVLIGYNFIHKPAVLGILGAITGLKGYGNNRKEKSFAEYYDIFKNVKIAIIPYYDRPLKKTIIDFNNASGLASENGTWQIKEQILIGEPIIKYEIIILEEQSGENQKYIDRLKNNIILKSSEFPLYFGKNEFFAWFDNYREYEVKSIDDILKEFEFSSLIKIENFEEVNRKVNFFSNNSYYAIYEQLPYNFNDEGFYMKDLFIFSNKKFKKKNSETFINIYSIKNSNKDSNGEKNVQFF